MFFYVRWMVIEAEGGGKKKASKTGRLKYK